MRLEESVMKGRIVRFYSPDLCDLGVKTAAFAAFGEMVAAPRDEGVKDPLVLGWSGVKDGESTLNLFFIFSF